jgi:hypothetical protein
VRLLRGEDGRGRLDPHHFSASVRNRFNTSMAHLIFSGLLCKKCRLYGRALSCLSR